MDHRRHFLVNPGSKIHLAKIDPSYTDHGASHQQAGPEIRWQVERMGRLQYQLYADAGQPLLIVLQGLDAAGKDEVIRQPFNGLNRQGTSVCGFRQPSRVELAHDFLWRVHLRAAATW